MAAASVSTVVRITSLAPTSTDEKLKELFEFVGTVKRVYVSTGDITSIAAKEAYVEFDQPDQTALALHLTSLLWIDRPITIDHVDNWPGEAAQQSLTADAQAQKIVEAVPRLMSGSSPATVGGVATAGPDGIINLGNTDPNRVEEIRRTVYCGNLDSKTVTADHMMQFFKLCGTINFVRMAGDETQPTRFAFIEFTTHEAANSALMYNGAILEGRPMKVNHSKNAIVKPPTKKAEVQAKEYTEAQRKIQEAAAMLAASLTTSADEPKDDRKLSVSDRDRDRDRARDSSRARARDRGRDRDRDRDSRRSRRSRSRSTSKRSTRTARSRSRDRRRSSRRSRSPRRERDRRHRSRSKSPHKDDEKASRRSGKADDKDKSSDKKGTGKDTDDRSSEKDKDAEKDKDKDSNDQPKDRSRDKDRESRREKEGGKSGDKDQDKGSEKSGDKDRSRDKEKERGRDRDRDRREKDKGGERKGGEKRERSRRSGSRGVDRHRHRDGDSDRKLARGDEPSTAKESGRDTTKDSGAEEMKESSGGKTSENGEAEGQEKHNDEEDALSAKTTEKSVPETKNGKDLDKPAPVATAVEELVFSP